MKKERKQLKSWNFPKKLFGIFLFCFAVIYAQFAYLSLSPNIYGINMDEFAEARNTYSTTLYAKRGTIYDKEGNTLALNVSSYTVIAYLSPKRTGSNTEPLHVVDVEETAKKLSPILNMTEEALTTLLTKEAYQVELGPGGRGITEVVKEEIEALNLPGIDFVETFKRYYPNGDFASYILGYAKQYEEQYEVDDVQKVEYKIVGELGIEAMFEKQLTGTNGYLKYQRDRYGYKIPDTPEEKIEAKDGYNVYLTLDSNIQRFTETAVKDTEQNFNPEWMTLTVMNAKTGEILASSSTPSFNPNLRNITNYENPLVSYVYEPGSTMKVFTYMCAIESGKYDGNTIFKSGSVEIGDDVIGDWNGEGWGYISLDLGFEYSSNVGATYLVQNVINKTELRDCLESYGFGEKTNIELPREMNGSLKFTYPIEVATASFGQGITTTAIQQLQALTIIANNGSMVKPYIIEKVVDPNTNEVIEENKTEKGEQIVKTSTINKVKDLMYNVVNGNNGWTTGRAYRVDGFDIIGKTGTAQIYDANQKKYLDGVNNYIYSFAGMFPKDDPEIIIYAAMKKPTHSESYGLSTAVKKVIQDTAKYLNIYGESSQSTSTNEYELPSFSSKSVESVKQTLEGFNITPIIIGNGDKVIKQYPLKGTRVLSYDKVFLMTNDTNKTIPNLIGWSKKDVKTILDMLGVNYTLEGYGYVTSQSIEAGVSVTGNETITLIFSDKYNINSNEEQ